MMHLTLSIVAAGVILYFLRNWWERRQQRQIARRIRWFEAQARRQPHWRPRPLPILFPWDSAPDAKESFWTNGEPWWLPWSGVGFLLWAIASAIGFGLFRHYVGS